MRRPADSRLLFLLLFVALIAVRVPSLAEPAGADQGLYAYVGTRILAGELPYRDAWDQKPPAVHFTYAAMLAAWDDLAVVTLVDIVVAAATALVLLGLGSRLAGSAAAGRVSALLFLFLSNPVLGRLGGVRVRGQCEVFIGLAVSAALLLLWDARAENGRASRGRARHGFLLLVAGALFGLAVAFKYNAATYALPALVAFVVWPPREARVEPAGFWRPFAWVAAGSLLVAAAFLAVFAAGGALDDLYAATVIYNLDYSGETYGGALDFARHLVTFPVAHARVDSLWWLGGLGTVTLIVQAWRRPALLVVPAWVVAACLSIAINGGRGLPQYFVQAGPALALAAGLMLTAWWRSFGWLGRVVLVALAATGIWRVSTLPKAADYFWFDVQRLAGRLDERTYLARFGEPSSEQKYSALAMHDLASYIRAHSAPDDRVLIFGFSQGALVLSERQSASRFFWSRPVVVGFLEGTPGYGASGLLADLERTRPVLVVLQRNDWQREGVDSATYFLGQPRLRAWLTRSYAQAEELGNLVVWRRVTR